MSHCSQTILVCITLSLERQCYFISINTSSRCIHSDKPPLEIGGTYWKLKDSVAQYELVLVRALHFQMHLDLPHRVSD